MADLTVYRSTFFAGGGEMGERMRAHDWAATPLGTPETWPVALLSMVSACLNSPLLSTVLWGPDLIMLYNDAYIPSMADRHPRALGHPVADVWGASWDLIAAPFHRAMATGEGFARRAVEIPMVRLGKHETTYWDFTATPIRGEGGYIVGLLNQGMEITGWVLAERARIEAEAALREMNSTLEQQVAERSKILRLYADIIQTTAEPICAFDTDYRLIAFNQAHSDEFFRIFGYRVQLGEVFPDLFPPEQGAIMRAFMTRALAGEVYTITEEFGNPDLIKPRWEVAYTPLRDASGQIIGAFHYARDITARLRAENELQVAQEQLQQSQKLEAIGQLTGGVAHDFNNLLTVIKSSTDLLKRPDLPLERRTRYVTAISETVDRAAKLTGQLLAFARRQALKPEIFDAVESVRAISEMMETLSGSRIRIVTQLPNTPCFLRADPSQFDTALVNMAVNARDAMEGEGQLTICVEAVEQMPAVRTHVAVSGAFVAVSIIDTGSGIPEERQEKIFEPFFTTKGVGQGTGLGLSQVFGFAKQSGGEVTVTSTVGKGSAFTLYLPRVEAAAQAMDAGDLKPLVDGHGTCVLVVEDNASVGTFAVQTLADLGYVTVWAANAEEALAELSTDAERFDVVFSDVVMPGMNGIDLAHEIRRQHPDLPVLLASGYSHVLAQKGTDGFELLHKPYSIEQLSRLLRKVANWQRRKRIIGLER